MARADLRSARAPAPGHFRDAMGLSLSSIGLGTYLGDEDAATDAGYEASVAVGARAGDQRVRLGDQLPRPEERARDRPRPGEGLRRRSGARGTRSSSRRRAATSRTTRDDPRPARRYVQETFLALGPRPEGRDRAGLPLHRARLPARPDRPQPREPRPRDRRPLLPPQRRDAARRRRPRRVPHAADAGDRDPRRGGRARAASPPGVWRPGTACACRPSIPSTCRSLEVRGIAREVAGTGHHFRGRPAAVQPRRWRRAWAIARRRPGRAVSPRSAAARALGLAAFGSASILQGRLAAELPEEIARGVSGGLGLRGSRRSSSPGRRRG